MQTKNIFFASLYFLLSTIITWWFIKQGKLLYFSQYQMLLSYTIAGAKWGIQIVAALLFLKDKKWEFLKLIGFVCFIGSCILLPYCLFDFVRAVPNIFLFSLIIAVLTMVVAYYKVPIKIQISEKWFWGWMYCLTIAIFLQLFIVFKIQV